jgi:hypothetical protein
VTPPDHPPSPSGPVPEEPLAGVGREPLHAAIASARDERRGGVSPRTLVIAAAASAAASYAASHLWGAGTVLSAALTPVVVALVSEFLRRPVERVSATAQRVAPIPIIPRPGGPAGGDPAPPGPPRPAAGDTRVEQGAWAPVTYEEPARQTWRPRWRLVLVTGLLAFAIVAAVYTVPELLIGHSITGAGGQFTLLQQGGSAPTVPTVTTQTTTAPTQTVTVQVQTTTVVAPPTAATAPTTTSTTTAAPTLGTPTDTTTTQTTTSTNPASTTPAGGP